MIQTDRRPTMKEKALHLILAGCTREERLRVIAIASQMIEYQDQIEQTLRGCWLSHN